MKDLPDSRPGRKALAPPSRFPHRMTHSPPDTSHSDREQIHTETEQGDGKEPHGGSGLDGRPKETAGGTMRTDRKEDVSNGS